VKTSLKLTLCFILLAYTCPGTVHAQNDSSFKLINAIQYPIVSFTVSNIGELYIINTSNQLKKLDDKGDSVGVFNMVTKYGRLSYVEAQNPWRIILFYKNFLTIVLLDKYLNLLTNINLRKQNIFSVSAVTSSYDNNIWLYDAQENKLKKIDDAGKILMETVDFRRILDPVPSPVQIKDNDAFVYLYDPKNGLYIFDYYGSFKNKLSFLNWKDFTVLGNTLYGFDNNFFYIYELRSLNLKKYTLPLTFKKYTDLKVGKNRLYLLKNNNLQIFSLP
jgi:hypothetical protein